MYVEDRENAVEAREERRIEVDLVRDVLPLDEPPELRVRGGKDCAARRQRGGDPRLRDVDHLLLHRLVDASAVRRIHFLDLVDDARPAVREDKGARLEGPASLAELVFYRRRQKARGARALPAHHDAAGCDSNHVHEKLRFGGVVADDPVRDEPLRPGDFDVVDGPESRGPDGHDALGHEAVPAPLSSLDQGHDFSEACLLLPALKADVLSESKD